MRIDLTPDQENQVIQIAAQAGRDVAEITGEMFSRFLSEEARFIAAIELGEADLDRGDFLTHSEVGARVRRLRGA
jgi:predicted transcriptional regulator